MTFFFKKLKYDYHQLQKQMWQETRLNRHFRFSWDSTLCPISAAQGSSTIKVELCPKPKQDTHPAYTTAVTCLSSADLRLQSELGDSAWSLC